MESWKMNRSWVQWPLGFPGTPEDFILKTIKTHFFFAPSNPSLVFNPCVCWRVSTKEAWDREKLYWVQYSDKHNIILLQISATDFAALNLSKCCEILKQMNNLATPGPLPSRMPRPENTHLLCKENYHCTADPLELELREQVKYLVNLP